MKDRFISVLPHILDVSTGGLMKDRFISVLPHILDVSTEGLMKDRFIACNTLKHNDPDIW
jgi:hypothetical protein